MACGDVTTGATSQAYCDNISSGCKYNSGACYVPGADCTAYIVSGSDAAADKLKCQNFVNNAGKYCSYGGSGKNCAAPITDCTGLSGTTTALCGVNRLDNGKACYFSSGTKCAIPDADECKAVTDISSADCDLYTTVGSCYNVSGTCTVKQAACTSYNYSSGANDTVKVSDC
jgi:hypothetical protein